MGVESDRIERSSARVTKNDENRWFGNVEGISL